MLPNLAALFRLMTKLLTIYCDDGRFQPIFRRPLAAKLPDHLYHHTKFGGNRATHVSVRGRNVMFFTFFSLFVYNAPPINVAGDLVAVFQQEIVSAFLGGFR